MSNKYLDLAREVRNICNVRMMVILIKISGLGTVKKRIEKRTENFEDWRINRDYPNYIIVKIGKNTQNSPRDPRTFAVTQTPEKYHQLKLV